MKDGTYKFVRVAGEYRLCSSDVRHSEMVFPYEKLLSAGFLTIGGGRFNVSSVKSSSLNIGPDENDSLRLELVLGMRSL